jgi:hypothetical protein
VAQDERLAGRVLPNDSRVDAVEYRRHLLVALGRAAELVAIDEQILLVVGLARARDLGDDFLGPTHEVERVTAARLQQLRVEMYLVVHVVGDALQQRDVAPLAVALAADEDPSANYLPTTNPARYLHQPICGTAPNTPLRYFL